MSVWNGGERLSHKIQITAIWPHNGYASMTSNMNSPNT